MKSVTRRAVSSSNEGDGSGGMTLPSSTVPAVHKISHRGNVHSGSYSIHGNGNNNNNNSSSGISSLICKVITLLTLIIGLYFGIVIQFAMHHYNQHISNRTGTGSTGIHSTSNTGLDRHQPEQSSKERWDRIKQERSERDSATTSVITDTSNKNDKKKDRKNEGKKINPFRLHNLDAPLTHGVEPEVLLKPEDTIHHIALKDDDVLHKHPTPDYILTAYMEPINQTEWDIQPLPKRSTATLSQLTVQRYPRVHTCSQFLQQFPVDDNPCTTDSFLPWIHDVFPTHDGRFIQFVAQNQRRCKNGSKEKHILHQQQPQAALFQHISIKQVPPRMDDHDVDEDGDDAESKNEPRFRLATHDDADPEHIATRFLCRFKPDLTVTTSVFNFDYDWTAFRKRYKNSFDKEDAGIKAIHTSQLIFKCPVPVHLQERIRTGSTIQNDYATLFVDIIPIRTPPRFGPPDQYLLPQYKEFQSKSSSFEAPKVYGTNHVLPKIKHSGRWENIPICLPSLMQYEGQTVSELPKPLIETDHSSSSSSRALQQQQDIVVPPQKKHRLVSCIWASAGYTTRGSRAAINDGQRRLLEWINYNSIIGFDHIYVYDNSGAFSNEISLKPVTDLFPNTLVTYIPWPSQVCNNNPNNVDSVGERSSQYAAESSCRLRFGPHVDWIGQFDIDEYLVPMGEMKTITQLLDKLDAEDTRIISFASWRAWPRRAYIDDIVPITDPTLCWSNEPCFDLKIPYKYPMLQAYNCDRQKPGEKKSSMPAEKQLYRADYVLQHFVHYSVSTVLSEKNMTEYMKEGFRWKERPFPDPRQRFGNEKTEGLMIHTKSVARQDTAGYNRMCHINNTYLNPRRQGLCRLGVPFPDDFNPAVSNATKEGYAYNCYVNEQVENYLVPQLIDKLKRTANFFDTN